MKCVILSTLFEVVWFFWTDPIVNLEPPPLLSRGGYP